MNSPAGNVSPKLSPGATGRVVGNSVLVVVGVARAPVPSPMNCGTWAGSMCMTRKVTPGDVESLIAHHPVMRPTAGGVTVLASGSAVCSFVQGVEQSLIAPVGTGLAMPRI